MKKKKKKSSKPPRTYFWKLKPPQVESQQAPSGGITEDIILIGYDTSVCVMAPEHLPVGQDVEVEDGDIDDPDPMQA